MVIHNTTQTANGQSRKEFLALAKECHPDLHPDDPEATEKFQKLYSEYNTSNKNSKKYFAEISITLQNALLGCERFLISNDGKRRFLLKVPAGVLPKEIIKYSNVQIDQNNFSELNIRIHIELPNNYSIKNGWLINTVKIPFWKLFFGGDHGILSPDGTRFRVNLPKRTKIDSWFTIENEGLYDRKLKKRNKLFIHII